ncbi:MAG: HAMP domain-containing histidine kinase [Deltaproteobacteria bacterium]|nr:HAMP domain-containing histidine kinase [Deltaproteobacteria bacterium]MBW2048854.1 HAMP domain-containing histidine kinase [Deltaproteobacteria bacterium]MBW2110123.1 HAMP domain-containing histidine kinase [Deltaproteobacteria bacterium]MBW2352593.1 HAMP domain-containing histidine kinase [Deltaproteobacteria bacterium]HDZ90296.1 HAMP domain-containing histidine kinase [Deltaproteobacteria bacterium]
MNPGLGIREGAALHFFGKMSASISHEIKNVLAIINENAGLLEDYNLMAERGSPVGPGRLKALADTIMAQIRRADAIVKNMNRFAHSVDEEKRAFDVGDILELVVALSSRFASVRGVELKMRPRSERLSVVSYPFFLANLLWLALDFAMGEVGKGKTVELVAEKSGEGVVIRLTRLEALENSPDAGFPGEREDALLQTLGAGLSVDHGEGRVTIELPAEIGP